MSTQLTPRSFRWSPVARQVRRSTTVIAFLALVVATTTTWLLAPSADATPVAAGQQQCGHSSVGSANPSLDVDRRTIGVNETAVVQVTGSDYLVPQHRCGTDVFGGVYVFFGWVQPGGTWGPSHRSSSGTQGLFGTSFSYPGEGGGGEIRDDGSGVVRLVAFTAGGESGTSTDFHMDANGNWRANLTVRGATYTFKDIRTGTSNTVDCTVVQCGVFTIGAHGKASATNERFTPINFTDGSGNVIAPRNPAAGGSGGATSRSDQPFQHTAPGVGAAAEPGDTGTGAEVDGDTTTDNSTPDPVGSVGEVAEESPAGDDTSGEEPEEGREVDGERAAAVQSFQGDSGGSSGGLAVIGIAAAVLVAAVVAAIVLQRRHRSTRKVTS